MVNSPEMLFVSIPKDRMCGGAAGPPGDGLANRRNDPNSESKLCSRLPPGRRLSFGPCGSDVLCHLNLKGLLWERDPLALRVEPRMTAMYAHFREVAGTRSKGMSERESAT